MGSGRKRALVRHVGGAFIVAGAIALVAACTAYGEDGSGDGDGRDGGASRKDASTLSSPGEDGSSTTPPPPPPPPDDSGVPVDLPDCPPCPSGATCIASGCKGPNITTTSCSAPFDLPTGGTLTVFVCSGGETTNLAGACNGGGTLVAAAFRLGAKTNENWTIAGKGAKWFAATNCGSSGPNCNGGNSTAGFGNAQSDYIGTSTIVAGTQAPLSGCAEVSVRATK